jgi:hypothetical protein
MTQLLVRVSPWVRLLRERQLARPLHRPGKQLSMFWLKPKMSFRACDAIGVSWLG